MIFFLDLDLVISDKTIHEGKYLMSGTCIDNMINEGCWEVVFGTGPIQIVEVCMVPYFLFMGMRFETYVV